MTRRIVLVILYPFNAFLMVQPGFGFPSSDLSCKQLLWLHHTRSDFVATEDVRRSRQVCSYCLQKVSSGTVLGAKSLPGTRFKRGHASQAAVLSLLPHADEPAVPADGGGADHGDGGAAHPTQVMADTGPGRRYVGRT